MNDSATNAIADHSAGDVGRRELTGRQRLEQLRSVETNRRDADQVLRKRMTWTGAVIGAVVALFVGFLGFAITIADEGASEFGFRFFRPDLATFFRSCTAYIVSGAFVGAALSYLVAMSRSTATNPLMWLGAGVVSIMALPLLIGFTLPLTLLIFFDFFEGLELRLWASAFTQEFLGSFFSGYLYMVNIIYAGALGAAVFVIATGLSVWIWIKDPVSALVGDYRIRTAIYIAVIAILTALPFLVVAFGPLDILRGLTGFLTGERLV